MSKMTIEDVKVNAVGFIIATGPKTSEEILNYLEKNKGIGSHMSFDSHRLSKIFYSDKKKRFKEVGEKNRRKVWGINGTFE